MPLRLESFSSLSLSAAEQDRFDGRTYIIDDGSESVAARRQHEALEAKVFVYFEIPEFVSFMENLGPF